MQLWNIIFTFSALCLIFAHHNSISKSQSIIFSTPYITLHGEVLQQDLTNSQSRSKTLYITQHKTVLNKAHHHHRPCVTHCHQVRPLLAPLHILRQHQPHGMDGRQRHRIQRRNDHRPRVSIPPPFSCPKLTLKSPSHLLIHYTAFPRGPTSAPASHITKPTLETGSPNPTSTHGLPASTATHTPATLTSAPQANS